MTSVTFVPCHAHSMAVCPETTNRGSSDFAGPVRGRTRTDAGQQRSTLASTRSDNSATHAHSSSIQPAKAQLLVCACVLQASACGPGHEKATKHWPHQYWCTWSGHSNQCCGWLYVMGADAGCERSWEPPGPGGALS